MVHQGKRWRDTCMKSGRSTGKVMQQKAMHDGHSGHYTCILPGARHLHCRFQHEILCQLHF